jgi:hypothetical protein
MLLDSLRCEFGIDVSCNWGHLGSVVQVGSNNIQIAGRRSKGVITYKRLKSLRSTNSTLSSTPINFELVQILMRVDEEFLLVGPAGLRQL